MKSTNQPELKSRYLRKTLVALTVGMLSAPVLVPANGGSLMTQPDSAALDQQLPQNVATEAAISVLHPRIQVAILLDTSNSMDGLIDQTRNQLWQVVNEFASARQNGVAPILEIALFEYGNDNNSRSSGYVRKLSAFTRELDQVSEGLFSLTTNGGNEYCGFAI